MTKVNELTIRKYGQSFTFAVLDNGRVEYRIGNGKWFSVKSLENGKAVFVKKQEIVYKAELLTIDSLELDEEDFSTLYNEQRRILDEKEKKNVRHKPVSDDVLQKVDKWVRKVKVLKDGKKTPVCIHDFSIGNDKYRFVERYIEGRGLIVNPDYLISEGLPTVGGIPKQYGELMFWDYLFDNQWKRVRTMTFNEQICYEIIKKYGYFAMKAKDEEGFKEYYGKKPLFPAVWHK